MNDLNRESTRNMATTLALAFVALSLTGLLILGIVGLLFQIQIQEEAITGRQQVVARRAADSVTGFIQEKFSLMETAVRLSGSERERERAMENLLGMEPAFRQLLLFNNRNEELFRVSRMSRNESLRLDKQLRDIPIVRVSGSKRNISHVYVDQVTSEPLVILIVPVSTILGDRLGGLVAEVNLKFIWQLVEELQVGKGGHAYVVDRQGKLLAFGDTARVLRRERVDSLRDVADFINHSELKDNLQVTSFVGITGNRVMGTYVPLLEPDWAVMTELPIMEAYMPVLRTGLIFAILLLIMSVLGGVLGLFLARRLAAPIEELTRTATRITDGEMDLRAAMKGPTEITQLSVAFNKMTRQMGLMLQREAERTQALEREISERRQMERVIKANETRLKNLTANVPGVVIQFRSTRHHVYTNEFLSARITEIFGFKPDPDLVLDQFYAHIPDSEKEDYISSIRNAINGVSPWNYEGRFNKPNGETIWFSGHALPQVEEDTIVYYGVLLDITLRKQMENSLRLTQFIYDEAPIGIWRMGESGEILDVNEKGCISLGYSREELCQMRVFDFAPSLTAEGWTEGIAFLDKVGTQIAEQLHRRKDGEIFPIQVIENRIRFEDQVIHVAFVQDISERKRMELALKESEERLDLALAGANEGIWDWRIDLDTIYFDPRYYTMAGYEPDEFPGALEEWEKRVHPDDIGQVKSIIDQYIFGDLGAFEAEFRFRRKDGDYMWIQGRGKIVDRDEHGNPSRFVGTHADITDRKSAEMALHENEQLLNNIVESINEGLLVLDTDFKYTMCNKALEDLGRTSRQEILGRSPWEVFPNFKNASFEESLKKAMSGELVGHHERCLAIPNHPSIWVRDNYSPLKDTDGEIAGVVVVVSDITRQKRDEEELRRLRNYLSNIINSMPSIIVAVDEEGKVTLWNNQTEKTTGIRFEEARSQPLSMVFPRLGEKKSQIETAIQERQVIRTPKVSHKMEHAIHFEDITIFPLVANGVDGAVIRVDDVTKQVRLEEMMIQSEKMLTVGGLAAGMAHEINNPLAGMLQTAAVMRNRLSTDLDIPANRRTAEEVGVSLEAIERFMEARGIFRMINTITTSGRRVADVVQNMLSFARKGDENVTSHYMNRILDSVLVLAGTDYDFKKEYDFKRIKIIKEYGSDLPPVPCQRTKIQQVLLNIFGNGAQAMQGAGTEEPQFFVRVFLDRRRNMVCVEIEDNGPGMDESTRKKVFDPFFTTKPTGLGIGLGLSVSYFIITENHQGEMAVESEPGAGAKFIISLPLQGRARDSHSESSES